jgi:hypothetical protein
MSQEVDRYRGNAVDMLGLASEAGLNPDAVKIMQNHLDRITIAGGRGSDVSESVGDNIVLVTLVIDESTSMLNVAEIVRRCYRNLVAALSELSGGNQIQLSTWVFNDKRKLLNSFRPVDKAPSTFNKYTPQGSTALYDTVLAALTSQVLYTQELWKASKQTRSIVIVISDGDNNSSTKDPTGLATLELAETLRQQGDYILAYIGLGDFAPLPEAECRRLAGHIGFTEVLSVGKTQQDMVDLFNKIAFAIKQVSQSTELVMSEDFFS